MPKMALDRWKTTKSLKLHAMGTKNGFLWLKMPEIDGLESKEQDKHENHCVLQNFCLGLFERDAFVLDQCVALEFSVLMVLG